MAAYPQGCLRRASVDLKSGAVLGLRMKALVFALVALGLAGAMLASPVVDSAEAHIMESSCPNPDYPCTPVMTPPSHWICHLRRPLTGC